MYIKYHKFLFIACKSCLYLLLSMWCLANSPTIQRAHWQTFKTVVLQFSLLLRRWRKRERKEVKQPVLNLVLYLILR